jgi:glycosyltransferase involved in cell wall biosynthesis
MPLYVVDSNSLQQRLALEQSPEAALLTNAAEPDRVPPPIRGAADLATYCCRIAPEDFRGSRNGRATIVWLDGETLLEGAPETIRRNLRHSGRTSFIPVHLPCIAHLDLLAVQPRFFASGKNKEEAVDFAIRVERGADSAQAAAEIFGEMPEPWARLSCALYREQGKPGVGLARLDRLRHDERLPPILDALALRNLAVLQLRDGRPQQAAKLLQQGKRTYPDYAELRYIEALLAVEDGDGKRAINLLEEIIDKPTGIFVGSGGENTYRAKWLVGAIGDPVGNQSVSSSHYFPGVCARPAFEPSVVGLLKLRLPADVVDSMQGALCHLARREPRYLEPVFYFLLVHRAFGAARRLLDTMDLPENQRSALAGKFGLVLPSYQKRPENSPGPAGVILTGPFFVHSSIARINGEIAGALLSRTDFSVGLEPHGFALVPPRNVSHGDAIAAGLYRRPPHLDLTIRHHWPHDFRRPCAGKLAVIVPWEFGAVPRAWIDQIQKNVDELWVPSEFVKQVFVRCGARSESIVVVPNGVNTGVFCPQGKSWRPPEASGFTFLFVGGAIPRKGVDVLVRAYQKAFPNQNDVTLIVKDIGSKTFYRHMTLVPWLCKEAENTPYPRLITLLEEFDETKLAELYRGADAIVLPYRGEGFGMPLVEAMSCGKPVIATAEGPAAEFCPADCSYLIPAKTVPIPGGIEGFGELAGEPTWFEPDLEELARAMRRVYENQTEAAARGARSAERIRPAYHWGRIAEMYIERMASLTEREVRAAVPALQSSD